jgi:class 3 adenylate cyclase/ribosomal protein S18 acetylase RimI-like enzyme
MPFEPGVQGVNRLLIRDYRDADWPAVCAVHDRARPDELRGSCDLRAFVPLAEEQEDAESFQRSHKFVACVGEQIVGFVGVDGTYLSWLYVDPAYYGQGIGRRLLRLGVQFIGPHAWTVALAGNTRARRLYESEGFQVVDTYDSANAGYPCTCVRLALSPPRVAGHGDQDPGGAEYSGVVPAPDRVLVTLLFTDIVGATERAAAEGDRRWRTLLERHHSLVRQELHRFRGQEVDTAGDAFFATFDGPARALRCACAIREAVTSLGLTIRAGLHTGECEVLDEKVSGIAVHIGARVLGKADPGEILVSRTVKDVVAGSGLCFVERGVYALKRVPDEWQLYAVEC